MVTAWCWGAGWDSTAGIILDVLAGRPIDLIAFADHGGEKRFPDRENGEEVGTYDFIPIFDDWLRSHDYPGVTISRYAPKPETADRYLQATRRVIRELQLESEFDEEKIKHMGEGIFGNLVANATLPSLSFGSKACSHKHKVAALEFT